MKSLDLARLQARAKNILAGFTPGQRVLTVLAVVGLLLGGFMFSKWAGRPSYAPLFTSLSSSDAAAITDKLTSEGAQYKLSDGGQTVLVPQGSVYQLRLDMSKAGLPKGQGDGYTLLQQSGITTSEFQQQVQYQQVLEQELGKTIGKIDGVQAAVVKLAIPQQDVFAGTTEKPSASVLLSTAPGTTIGPETVQSIVHLVSSSIVGMPADAVTVADSTGQLLSGQDANGASLAAGDIRAQQTLAYEQSMDSSIQQMLNQVVGPGHAVVRVNADLDFDARKTTSETYVADPKVPPIAQSTTKESYSGTGQVIGGVVGPDANNAIGGAGTGGAGKYSQEQTTVDNSVGKITQVQDAAPGSVKRLSVAVILDAATAGNVSKAEVSRLVSNAAGVLPSRGDTVQVSTMAFDQSAAKAAQKALNDAAAAKKKSQMMSIAKTLGALLAVLAVVLLAMRQSKRRLERTPVLLGPDGPYMDEARRELAAYVERRTIETSETRALEPIDPADTARDEISQLVERQPEEVAQLLRGWLGDRRG